jgi:hypothetical protein
MFTVIDYGTEYEIDTSDIVRAYMTKESVSIVVRGPRWDLPWSFAEAVDVYLDDPERAFSARVATTRVVHRDGMEEVETKLSASASSIGQVFRLMAKRLADGEPFALP